VPKASPTQLHLFELPASSSRRRTRRTSLRVVVTVLALGVATAGILTGSYAAWTAQTSNPLNSVASGTLTMSNDKAATSIFTASNVKPGDTGSNTVTVANTGSIPMSVKLTQDLVTSTGIEASLGLKVYDQTRNRCYWPVDQAGACPVAYGAWNATSSLTAKSLPNSSGGSQWASGESHTFTISWQLAATSPNSDQGKTGSFRFAWDGTQ